jgi:hypothetical protein
MVCASATPNPMMKILALRSALNLKMFVAIVQPPCW